jgi:hypothetical protein
MGSVPPPEIAVRHDASAHRYTAEINGELSFVAYELDGSRMIFTETWTPPALRGRGIAEALVRRALADARQAGRVVVPQCSYVARFLGKHPEITGPGGQA